MLSDRFGLALTTKSSDARDAYVEGSELALTFYPGAIEAYDRALAADPDFALAHAGKAQVRIREGKAAEARGDLAAAKALTGNLSDREASHVGLFDLIFSGQTDAAVDAMYAHLGAWPQDALVVSVASNPNGILGGSGRIGQKRKIAELMDSIAPHYGDDYWFVSYHAMALSEDGQLAAAWPKIEHSAALNRKNAHLAHGYAHICYESGEGEKARAFLTPWLADYPHEAFFHGHLSWHLSLVEIQLGNWERAQQLYRDGIVIEQHSGGPLQRMSDGAAFLWRSELAGHPRNAAAWRVMHEYAASAMPQPAAGLADLHVILAHAVAGDDAGRDARARKMEEMAGVGRYPSGSYLPTLSPGFAAFERGDYDAAIAVFAPLAGQNERIGGSRAQHDLIEFTLLKAYLNAGRLDEARSLIAARRPGASGLPVAGAAALH